MAVYLIDKPFGGNGLALAAIDEKAKIVLIQDGVYLDVGELGKGRPVYALEADVKKRGLETRLPAFIKRIDYAALVDLIVEDKVFNFA